MRPPVIEISGLTKFYGKTRGIQNVDLEVREGEIFGFIGPNGAGKSTTIRILLNLIFPTGGVAKIMGLDVTRESKKIRQNLGYIPSDANAYRNMDVREFLTYCMRFYNTHETERMNRLAAFFDLDLDRRISDLSMGNRKKVSIVQGLVHNPRLLILDEPTTGLDPLIQARFFEALREENRNGMTIFFSSHILSEIQTFCKRVAIIKDGRIIKTEEIDALRRKQLKKVNIVFRESASAGSFSINGSSNIMTGPDNNISFMYSGNIGELLNSLADKDLDDLTIEEPMLEEIFMHYYQ